MTSYGDELSALKTQYGKTSASAYQSALKALQQKYQIPATANNDALYALQTATPMGGSMGEVSPAPNLGTTSTGSTAAAPATSTATTTPAVGSQDYYNLIYQQTLNPLLTGMQGSNAQLQNQLAGSGLGSSSAYQTALTQNIAGAQNTAEQAEGAAELAAPQTQITNLQSEINNLSAYANQPGTPQYTAYWNAQQQLAALTGVAGVSAPSTTTGGGTTATPTTGTTTPTSWAPTATNTGQGVYDTNQQKIDSAESRLTANTLTNLSGALGNLHGYGGTGDELNNLWNMFDQLHSMVSNKTASQDQVNQYLNLAGMMSDLALIDGGNINFNDGGQMEQVRNTMSKYGFGGTAGPLNVLTPLSRSYTYSPTNLASGF